MTVNILQFCSAPNLRPPLLASFVPETIKQVVYRISFAGIY